MGRAINMANRQDEFDNRQDEFDKRLKLVEDALEELVQTRVHHVDLTADTAISTRKKTTKKKTVTVD